MRALLGNRVFKVGVHPPGVNAASEVKIPKGKNEADYPINANSGAATGTWPFVVNAYAEVDGGRLYTASPVTMISIHPHMLGGSIEMAALERGEQTEVVVKLNPAEGFKGEGTLELFGLPNGVSAEPQKITSKTKQVVFPLKTTDKSPIGQHKSLFCRLTVQRDGAEATHSLAGGGVLRIDRPRQNTAATKTQSKKGVKKPARRLSRLEKLRLEQARRLKEKTGDRP